MQCPFDLHRTYIRRRALWLEPPRLFVRGYVGEDAMWQAVEQQHAIRHRRVGRSRTSPKPTSVITGISNRRGRGQGELPDQRHLLPPRFLRGGIRCELAEVQRQFCTASATRRAARMSVPPPHPLTDHTTSSFRAGLGSTSLAQRVPARNDSRRTIRNSVAGANDGSP